MDPTLAIYVVLGAAAAGFVQGLSGFAFAMTAMAFWAWVVAPQLAGPMVVFGSLIGQLMSIGVVRASFDLKRVLPFVIGGLAGVPIGVALLKNIDQTLFRLLVGSVLVVYGSFMLFVRHPRPVTGGGRSADAGIGFVGGVMGGIGGFSGAAPTIWTQLRGWKRDAQRAVYQTFNLVMHAATFIVYVGTGLVTVEALWMFALVIPAMIVPALIGVRLYKRISDLAFRRVVLLLLAVSGAALVVSAVQELAAV